MCKTKLRKKECYMELIYTQMDSGSSTGIADANNEFGGNGMAVIVG